MKHRKFQKLYSLLTRQERKKFERYLFCEFGKNDHKVIKTFHAIQKRKSNEQLWASVFPEKKYNYGACRKLVWDLNKHLGDFLAIIQLKKDRKPRDYLMLQEINERGNSEVFYQNMKKAFSDLEEEPYRDDEYYFARFNLQNLTIWHSIAHRTKDYFFDYKEAIESLDLAWVHNRLLFVLGEIDLILIKEDKIDQIDSFTAFIIELSENEPSIRNSPTISLYLNIYGIISGLFVPKSNPFIKFKETYKLLSPYERINTLGLLLNHQTRLHKKSYDEAEIHNFLNLYHWAAQERLIEISGKVPILHLKNIIGLCILLNKNDLAKTYLDLFEESISDDKLQEDFLVRKGTYLLSEEKNSELIKLISSHNFNRPSEKIKARLLIIHAHFSKGEREWLRNRITALKKFLDKTIELTPTLRNAFQKNIDFLSRLIQIESLEELEILEKEITQTWPIINRNWFLKEIERIKANWKTLQI